MKKVIFIALLGILLLGTIIPAIMYVSYNNQEVQLRNEAKKQLGKIEAVHDEMWKVLQQKAGIADKYRDAFRSSYTDMISGRYSSGDGTLMKWIKEQNPTFDASLYKDVQAAIEIQRSNFTMQQARMLDIIRQHDNLLSMWPSSAFIKNTEHIKYTVISSTRSKTAVETGLDNDISL
jgi:Na+-transporting NADH:ubiquinone oxidoreductase subunit NqrC